MTLRAESPQRNGLDAELRRFFRVQGQDSDAINSARRTMMVGVSVSLLAYILAVLARYVVALVLPILIERPQRWLEIPLLLLWFGASVLGPAFAGAFAGYFAGRTAILVRAPLALYCLLGYGPALFVLGSVVAMSRSDFPHPLFTATASTTEILGLITALHVLGLWNLNARAQTAAAEAP